MVGRHNSSGLRAPHHFLDGLFKFRNIFVLGICRELGLPRHHRARASEEVGGLAEGLSPDRPLRLVDLARPTALDGPGSTWPGATPRRPLGSPAVKLTKSKPRRIGVRL